MTDPLEGLRNRKIHVESYGCTFNHADTCKIIEIAEAQGCRQVPPGEADVFIINTCTVVESTERHMLRRMGAHANREVVVTGCMPVVQPDAIRTVCTPTIVLPEDLYRRCHRIGGMVGPGVGAVQVGIGCLGQCSYCITRQARGRLRSFPADAIAAETASLVAQGAREIQLTGQDVSAYGTDTGTNLANLLLSLSDLPGDFRIRVGMMNPATVEPILDDLVGAFGADKLFRFVHLPVQSGSDAVLKAMQRGYTTDTCIRIVNAFRRAYPDIRISTDFIAGFPTESDEDFDRSIDLFERIRPTKVNITRYSQRPGTQAARHHDLPDRIKKERSRIMTAVANRLYDDVNETFLGRVLPVMVTEQVKAGSVVARDDCYNNVVIRENLSPGTMARVKITDHHRHYLIGERISSSS